MSILDLQRRVTQEWKIFEDNKRSPDSFVYVEGAVVLPNDCKVALDLAVGEQWYDHQRKSFWTIPVNGLKVSARTSVIIETSQKFTIPYNVFGLVTGKGKLIYQEVIISPGKIDPGFMGRLRIGLYNASQQTITLKVGDLFCSCCFFNLESDVAVPIHPEMQPPVTVKPIPLRYWLFSIFQRNWDKIFMLLLTAVSTVAAVIAVCRSTK